MSIEQNEATETKSAADAGDSAQNETAFYRDKRTGEPCARRGAVLCLNTDLHHLHEAIPNEEPADADATTYAEAVAGPDPLGTYVAMMDEYLREQKHWIGPAQQPLVFHMRKMCQKLDANPDAPASLSSAYLQAFRRLDLQRPGNKQPAGADGALPGQGSIFDELDD